MHTKFFTQESLKTQEDKEKRIQFVHNVYSVLSRDTSMSEELKKKILIGSLIHTNLTAQEILDEIESRYTPFNS
ncbi:Uncharacterised protein [Legionella steigerwaltii]|uniref:Uncharacterized protein n=1 Tax=Legionella steigerwaltii TaxID=460 RepID=A0A378LC13_9GAMM|nr:hypothetical protein [Legionella steigerwaltii]KTD77140.1 hypothetical protein Lstg_2232 [Legionella steigerwaltii]STY21631.1 Uncharacterised protein [Legionella steigerwaltii]